MTVKASTNCRKVMVLFCTRVFLEPALGRGGVNRQVMRKRVEAMCFLALYYKLTMNKI